MKSLDREEEQPVFDHMSYSNLLNLAALRSFLSATYPSAPGSRNGSERPNRQGETRISESNSQRKPRPRYRHVPNCAWRARTDKVGRRTLCPSSIQGRLGGHA